MSTNYVFANNVNTTLASPIATTGATSMTLSSTTNAPSPTGGEVWLVTLNDAATNSIFEIVAVTARTGAVCTIVRGQEGTAATTWLANDLAYGPGATAATLNNFALINGSSSNNFAVAALSMTGALTGATGITSTTGNIAASIGEIFAGASVVAQNYVVGSPLGSVSYPSGLAFGDALFQRTTSAGRINLGGSVLAGVIDYGVAVPGTFTISNGSFIVANATTGLNNPYFYGGPTADILNYVGVGAFGAGQAGHASVALSFGNAGSGAGATDLGSMGNTVDTIVGQVAQINYNGAAQFTLDTSGNIGILGTVHAASARSRKQRIEYVDPEEALQIVLGTKIARFDYRTEEPLASGQTRHASFIADDTPWQLSGGPGREHADPQKTASYALAAIAALHDRIVALEAHG